MTITTTDGTRGKFDWTKPVLALFALCLIVLIVMPLSWLGFYAVTD
jgi:iron(III) transport system permease protein